MPVQPLINNLVKLNSRIESRLNSTEDYITYQYEKHQTISNFVLLVATLVAGCLL